jgi:hypothetical protein
MADLKIAVRVLLRRPALAMTAMVMIALGIAAATAIYTVANDNRLVTRSGNYRGWKAESQPRHAALDGVHDRLVRRGRGQPYGIDRDAVPRGTLLPGSRCYD